MVKFIWKIVIGILKLTRKTPLGFGFQTDKLISFLKLKFLREKSIQWHTFNSFRFDLQIANPAKPSRYRDQLWTGGHS